MYGLRLRNLRGKNLVPHSSFYPIVIAFGIGGMALSFIGFMQAIQFSGYIFIVFFIITLIPVVGWAKQLFREFNTFQLSYNAEKKMFYIRPANVSRYLREFVKATKVAMCLFIISEVMFFFSFFWAFFHSLGSPAIQVGAVWPPFGLEGVMPNPLHIPLLNTLILLTSGVTVTWSHMGTLPNRVVSVIYLHWVFPLFLTILLALNFLAWQLYEFMTNSLQMSDGIYGSTFYILTGFHGLHVIVGTILLSIFFTQAIGWIVNAEFMQSSENSLQLVFDELEIEFGMPTEENYEDWNAGYLTFGANIEYLYIPSIGYECAIWYWHFVDVVWLLLFILVYLPEAF